MQEVGVVSSWLLSQHVLVSQEWLEACLDWLHQENQGAGLPPAQVNQLVYEQWLQADLRVVAPGCLPQGIAAEQKTVLNGKFALQINSLIDVSVPAYTQLQKLRGRENANDAVTAETQATQKPWEKKPTRMLMLQLTDGQQDLQGMEYQPIRDLAVDMTPGTKILVTGPVQCRLGVLLLDGGNVKVLGGEVEELAEENSMENILLKAVSEQGTADPNLVQQQQQIQQEYRQSAANNARSASRAGQPNNQGQPSNRRQPNNQGQPDRQPRGHGHAGFGQGQNMDMTASKNTPQPPATFMDDFEDDDFLDNMDLGELEMLENQEMIGTGQPRTVMPQNAPVAQQRMNTNNFLPQQNNVTSFQKHVKEEQTEPLGRGVMQKNNFSNRKPPTTTNGHDPLEAIKVKNEPEWDEPFDVEGVEQWEGREEGLDRSPRQSVLQSSRVARSSVVSRSSVFQLEEEGALRESSPKMEHTEKQENSPTTRLNRSDVFQIDDEPDWDDPLLMEGMTDNLSSIDNGVWDDPFHEDEGQRKDRRKNQQAGMSSAQLQGSLKPSLRPPTVQPKGDVDVKIKREQNLNQPNHSLQRVSALQDIGGPAVSVSGARGNLSTQKLVQTVAPFSREQPPEMKKRRLDTGVDLHTPPFTYLSKVLSALPVRDRKVVTVKAFILTLTSKLEKTDRWKMSAMINDGSAGIDVDLGDQVLSKLIGFTVPELKNLVVKAKTDASIKKRIKEGLEGCQRKLIDLSCLMEVEFSPTLAKPKVIALSDVNPDVLRQLQERVDRSRLN